MTLGLIFWILMLIWLVWGAWSNKGALLTAGPGLALEFILFLLLGWQVFGAPVRG
jgi:hypothetical protein